MLIFDSSQTVSRLPFDRLIDAIDAMFVDGCTVPLRHNHTIDCGPDNVPGTLLLMPAWQTGGRIGIKTVSVFPSNSRLSLPGLHSTFILLDATTGVPLAMLDGDVITSRRTAAASALAARVLSRRDSARLLVVGSGRVGSLIPEAYAAVRPIAEVMVWDIDTKSAAALVGSLSARGFSAQVADDLETAVRWADIVSCATLSTEPLIKGSWLRPGTHLDLIGGFTPTMRETDDDCFVGTSVFIDTDEALMKAGDLLSPMQSGAFDKGAIQATLAQLCRREHAGRRSRDEITVFKAVGTALEDLAAASLAYDASAGT
ncbi:ornithine cyclodeaminase family protein [Trinickia caryophylli]|uniref:Ornithine cyclodeaminase n=1 Tax=Trinickia caryophylli TaxID=28094 RepID=A0A1X7G3X9_TRICW|nr:ornithine cyclodeaminase family protein [Trinickia caryophylli]PMS13762.1 ornithine cyclodeaminase [Trinickia caryophylli]TRX14261.1 ornithine cyclodeaminase family protein [Trinickia caryophylli]WQE14092.1 ornithine cyclodeaminase family protein [Trinickia caryophylli]SMF63582.1 ornithine cyclodeaminase [Trinickia caryophylli]GLU33414.1 ornithine cyclodeaminase [Trinickia caryophylli]